MKLSVKNIAKWTSAFGVVLFMSSCMKDPQSPGYEYMPDMYRSPAVEAYVDYGYYGREEHDELKNTMSVREPVHGTIPYSSNPDDAWIHFPYEYENNAEGYEAAGKELKNPIAYSEEVMAEGEALYLKFCVHCHGEAGDGQGMIVQNGHLAGIPAYNGQLAELPEGKMFHSITYGKGLMGSHASQMDKAERWKVIHYVRSLQLDGNYPVEAPAETVTDTTQTMDFPSLGAAMENQNNEGQ